jgi:hypothetical protein
VEIEWAEVAGFLERFGLPIIVLALLIFRRPGKRRVATGEELPSSPFLVPGATLDDSISEMNAVRHARNEREHEIRSEAAKQIAFSETLRIEERDARIAGDKRLEEALRVMREQGDAMQELRVDVARLTGSRTPTHES